MKPRNPAMLLYALTIATLLALAVFSAPAFAAPFYVAPNGSDDHPGTAEKPFATLERARAALRTLPAGQEREVVIRGGTYRLGASFYLGVDDCGTPERPALWHAAPGETVRLVGSVALPPANFKPVADPAALARLDPAAREHVRQIDLRALNVAMPPEIPAKFRGAPLEPELFCDDQRMTLARWPNQGWATVDKIIDPGSDPSRGDKSGKPGAFTYRAEDGRPARWNVDAGVWLRGYWCYDWSEEAIRIKAIDPQTRQITLSQPHIYGLRQGNPSPRRYYALNLLEELDSPGEFYIDRAAGLLYFWPPAGTGPQTRLELSTLNKPMVLLKGASHVVLRGLTIEAGLGHGVEVYEGSGCRVEACTLRNLRQGGVEVFSGSRHAVVACDIHDTGTGGINLVGGDRKTLTPAGHEALNNHIWRFSQHQFTYACAIRMGGVGNRAAHNLIHDAPHMAIGLAGNDHVFEYNVVHDVCTETDDAGAFYTGRDPSGRGHQVRYNFWHHIGSPMGHGNAAIYFDDGDGGSTVLGNVFYRCGEPGKGSFGTVFSHGGHDLRADNNLFISCRRALGSAPWNDKFWKEVIDGGHGQGYFKKLREDVDITSPAYTTRYPELVGFLDPKPGQPRVSKATRNLLVMCGEMSGGNWQYPPGENWAVDHDPGFVDAGRGDFTLRPEAIKPFAGFEAIPFGKIGLYKDALRPNPLREKWNYPAMEQAKPPGVK